MGHGDGVRDFKGLAGGVKDLLGIPVEAQHCRTKPTRVVKVGVRYMGRKIYPGEREWDILQ